MATRSKANPKGRKQKQKLPLPTNQIKNFRDRLVTGYKEGKMQQDGGPRRSERLASRATRDK